MSLNYGKSHKNKKTNRDFRLTQIQSIEQVRVSSTKVYNLEVEDFHTYFVGEDGVWVHNYQKNQIASARETLTAALIIKAMYENQGLKVPDEVVNAISENVKISGGLPTYDEPKQDSILENTAEAVGHLTWGLPGTIIGGLIAGLDLTVGNAITGIHNLFTDDANDWGYSTPHIGAPRGGNDVLGIEPSYPLASIMRFFQNSFGRGPMNRAEFTVGPFAFFDTQGYSSLDTGSSFPSIDYNEVSETLVQHSRGHAMQNYRLGPLYLVSPILTWTDWFETWANDISDEESKRERR